MGQRHPFFLSERRAPGAQHIRLRCRMTPFLIFSRTSSSSSDSLSLPALNPILSSPSARGQGARERGGKAYARGKGARERAGKACARRRSRRRLAGVRGRRRRLAVAAAHCLAWTAARGRGSSLRARTAASRGRATQAR
jgi:hypothetical protein